jgi:superfamily II DNA or RNA helicase
MTEQYIKRIDYIISEINQIKKTILNDNEDIETILDSYEIDKRCYDYIDSKDEMYFKLFADILKMYFKKFNNIDDVFVKLKDYDKKNLKYHSFLNFLKSNFNIFQVKKIKDDELYDDSDSESDSDLDDDNIVDIKKEDAIVNFGLRKNQEDAREANKKNNFCSGIHNQVTGAGKSLLMMLTIYDHYNMNKEINNGKLYIITCPRVEVLNKMFFEKSKREHIINEENKEFWKNNNIIDLDDFKIFDYVNYKFNSKVEKIKLEKKKPNLLIINTDYFKIIDSKNYIDYSKLNFIIFDECHGVSAFKFYDLLHKIKFDHKKHIIGFSATPVRNKAEEQVKNIFSKSLIKNDKHFLNIISNYDIMSAISDNIVLPPSYTIVEIKKTCNKKIGKSNKDITEKIIKDKLNEKVNDKYTMPYKKIICWCKTIPKMLEWYAFFNTRFPELKLYCSTSKDNQHQKDGFDTDYDDFCEAENNAILLCVNRCREGSDIKNLDMGVYLDHIRKRGILVCIQTVGRILRPDKKKLKKCGYIIDTFINDGKIEIELMTAQKIISYYEKVLGLSCDDEYKDILKNYEKLKEMFSNTSYDEKINKIKIKIDDDSKHDTEIKLELRTKNFDWGKFKDKIGVIINKNFGIDEETNLKTEYKILKEKIGNINSPKIKIKNKNEYKEYAKLNQLEEHPEIKYKDYGWVNYYDFLDIDTDNFPKSLEELRIKCKNFDLNNHDIYIAKCHKFKLPQMPEEIYLNFTSFYNLFNNQTNKRRA